MRTHTHNLCKPINGWKVVGRMPLAESCLSFHLPFLLNLYGCKVVVLLSAQECFALHLLFST